ncbi:MAG TPA: hypothetical protein VEB86_00300, partial [Chryseosolibacter sp.]|nr:hypothetical protein [Chryseosolibacter sp.]
RVKNAGNSYECKPHPYTGWCNGAAWAYAPGTGTYWQDAWILKGPCTSARLQTHATPDPIVPESQESIFDDDGFSTFPVPGRVGLRNAVTLRFAQAPGEIVFELTDVNGGKLLNRELGNVQKEITVEFPALSTGLYLIHVRSAKRTWLKKYVIQ